MESREHQKETKTTLGIKIRGDGWRWEYNEANGLFLGCTERQIRNKIKTAGKVSIKRGER